MEHVVLLSKWFGFVQAVAVLSCAVMCVCCVVSDTKSSVISLQTEKSARPIRAFLRVHFIATVVMVVVVIVVWTGDNDVIR